MKKMIALTLMVACLACFSLGCGDKVKKADPAPAAPAAPADDAADTPSPEAE